MTLMWQRPCGSNSGMAKKGGMCHLGSKVKEEGLWQSLYDQSILVRELLESSEALRRRFADHWVVLCLWWRPMVCVSACTVGWLIRKEQSITCCGQNWCVVCTGTDDCPKSCRLVERGFTEMLQTWQSSNKDQAERCGSCQEEHSLVWVSSMLNWIWDLWFP